MKKTLKNDPLLWGDVGAVSSLEEFLPRCADGSGHVFVRVAFCAPRFLFSFLEVQGPPCNLCLLA